jgi:hypothetical protein
MTKLASGWRFRYRYFLVTCVAALIGCAVLDGCGGTASVTSSTRTASAAAATTATASERPSPNSTDYIVYYGDCYYSMKAWTTFLASYNSSGASPAEKNLAAATAASDIADAVYDMATKLPVTQSAVIYLTGRLKTFIRDFQTLENDLENGNTAAADSLVKTRLQSDANALDPICGPA